MNKTKQLLEAIRYNYKIPALLGVATQIGCYKVMPIITEILGSSRSLNPQICVSFRLVYPDDLQHVRNVSLLHKRFDLNLETGELTVNSISEDLVFKEKVGFFYRDKVKITHDDLILTLKNTLRHLEENISSVELFDEIIIKKQYLGGITSLDSLAKLQASITLLNTIEIPPNRTMLLSTINGKSGTKSYLHDYDENHLCIRIEDAINYDGFVANPSIIIAINKDGSYCELHKNSRLTDNYCDFEYVFVNDYYFYNVQVPECHKVDFSNTSIEFVATRHYEENESSKFFQTNQCTIHGNTILPSELKTLIEESINSLR
ncbi:hypothetical protein LMH73_019240 [Vibrio splendidus]|nr:hypothetical protein [Vibrio splendidus]MCC4880504.1 hypothetical protein [Vibrio splendidus]